jgi:hypothetical protein
MSHFNAEHVGLNIAFVLGGYMQDAITALYKRVVDAVVELMLPPILPA